MPNRRLLFNFQLLGQYWGHVWAILGSCFGYFYNIFASRCLKLLKFSQKNPCRHKILVPGNNKLFGTYWGHVWTIGFGYFYNTFSSRCLKLFKFSPKNHACYIEEYSLMFHFWDHIWAMFGPYQANVLAISIVSLLLRTLIMMVNGYFGIVW